MKTLTKNSEITAYGYACGYVTKIDSPQTMADYEVNYVSLSLYKENSLYVVSFYNRNNPLLNSRDFYTTLNEAKRKFNYLKKTHCYDLNLVTINN